MYGQYVIGSYALNDYLLVASSAILLYLAYAWPDYCCWLVLVFLVPLFIIKQLSSIQGFVWGILFYTMHLHPIAQVLYDRAHGKYRMLLYPVLILYFALHSGIWFKSMHFFQKKRTLWVLPAITLCFFVWMQCGIFWIFGVREGYPFALPIIPLGQYSPFVRMLPALGVYGLTGCLITAQWYLVQHKKGRYAYASSALYALFLIGFCMPTEQEKQYAWVEQLVYISPTTFNPQCAQHPLDCAQEIAYALQEGGACYKSKKVCFVLPEAAFPFTIESFLCEIWQTILDDNDHEMALGLHCNIRKITKNALFHLKSCRIIQAYEKNHATLFTERTPFYLKGYLFFTHLFGGNTDRSQNRSTIIEEYISHYSPFIRIFNYPFYSVLCSELFFNDFSSLPYKKVPILLLCNDNWFTSNQMKNLMQLYAKIYAMLWERPIVYISHTKGVFFSQTGRAGILCTIA